MGWARIDPGLALREYIVGHDRGWAAERKRREAERLEEPGPDFHPELPELPDAPPGRRFGVPVPERLDFHRGPDRWRDRLRRRVPGRE